jgi:uncharacterized membrane protein YcaP (DUF421 family)
VDAIKEFLGTDPKEFTVLQIAVRAFVTYFFTILVVRIGHKRFLGQATTFDAVLGFILGSVMSRAINGQAAFFPTLVGGFILISIHWGSGWLAMRSKTFAGFLKGHTHILVRDGKIDKPELRKHLIGPEEIEMYMHQAANIDDFSQVKSATLERSGQIGIVKKEQEPRIMDVKVEQGVQTVRIELHQK